MESVTFQFDSLRAQKARIGHFLNPLWRHSLAASSLVLILAGIAFIIAEIPAGWLLLGLSAIPAIVLEWWKGELQYLKSDTKSNALHERLAGDVLGRLPKQVTPRDIATAISAVPSGQFFSARFGIGARFLQDIASNEAGASEAVWRDALAIREKLDVECVTGSILLVALIKQYDGYETVLAHLQLGIDDLISGVRWHEHIHALIAKHSRPRRTGGIARDWSFGYIPLLTRFGVNISEQASKGSLTVELEAHQAVINQLIETFHNGGRQNAVLVGPAGAGKTTIVRAFAERLMDGSAKLTDDLKFRQVFMLDASSLIAAASGKGELEHLLEQVLSEAYRAKNVIVCLDNAQLFFEEGIGSVDVSNLLLPILEAGRLRMILAMDEQRYLQISQRQPALANALNRLTVAPATRPETIAVMQDQLLVIEYQRKVTYMYQALEEAYRLSERYVHELAMPGRALKLLESAASYSNGGLVTASSVQQAIEKTMDIKVGVASDETERMKLLNLEDLIHERMVNQTRAVEVVSDALRRARAGVRNQNRPIGTFLFLGPTGVGKTELAKSLAEVYFGGEEHLLRLDLNEYVRPDDVSRLIADGASNSMSLTAQVMKQPFSVILLDEIEKAHPNVLATLLQLLDEGILRDERNREISFRDAIVIATSNAGADRIREYIDRGYQLSQFEKQFTDELISSNQFRPEFLNRFDEIVIFRPLETTELVQVIDRILAGINKTLALQKISVYVEDDAKRYLAETGYDPRLGARPMRRIVQRAVENTVAKQVLAGTATPGSTITITKQQVEAIVGTRDQADAIVKEAEV